MIYEPKPYKITEIKQYGNDIKLFRVKTNMNPMPGHFFEVSILGVGECALASCSYNKDYVDILARNAGGVTNVMFNLKKGEEIFIRGPYGRGYPLNLIKKKNIILVAGGTGIAPVTSLIEYIEKNRKDFGEIKVFFGFRNPESILLKDRIDKWKKKFNFTLCFDRAEKKVNGEIGFVHEVIARKKPGTKNTIAIMCGPEIMMDASSKILNELGLENNKIYWNMERRMECAIGNCGRCLIQDVYVCKDGPVFRYDKIKTKLENEKS
jgi:anaerobic sulfite reductase subunit B